MEDDMISAFINWINWNVLLQFTVICGVVLTVFRMQTAEQLEKIVGCVEHHGSWGQLRRVTQSLLALSLLWCVSYGYERGWQPWPPMVIFILCYDLSTIVGIAIMRQDIKAIPRGDMAARGTSP